MSICILFGEQLVLAYNSGPGNVSKAIRVQEENKATGTSESICPKKTGICSCILATMYL
jgi:hypothetical protein